MKKILLLIVAIMALCSCRQASELPPIQDGYATTFVLPDPVDLTTEDRALIKALQEEYNNAIGK
jgi:hypothetical protein